MIGAFVGVDSRSEANPSARQPFKETHHVSAWKRRIDA